MSDTEHAQVAPPSGDFGLASFIQYWRREQERWRLTGLPQIIRPESTPLQMVGSEPAVIPDAELVVQSELLVGERTEEGLIVRGVSVIWYEILEQLARDPDFLHKVAPRKLEEVVAAAYERAGWDEVILTPHSGDRGRDVIATKHGFGAIRIFEQVKRYSPGHRVSADDVRALLGVLTAQGNVSKGIVTTTSRFAPGIQTELGHLIPYRLELKDGRQLREWLAAIGNPAAKKPDP